MSTNAEVQTLPDKGAIKVDSHEAQEICLTFSCDQKVRRNATHH